MLVVGMSEITDVELRKKLRKENCPCFCALAALYWFNYELVKDQLCEHARMPQANFSISFTAGAISGAVSTHH